MSGKMIRAAAAAVLLWPVCALAQPRHGLFTAVLQEHVRDGAVDYPSVCRDGRFRRYLAEAARIDPETLGTDKEKLAFWINVYNAWTIKIICDHYPLRSINELHTGGLALGMVVRRTVWDKPLVTVNGRTTSLSFIEHKIMRPRFRDARIHFALVCAAKGCPPLRSEAYEGDILDAQLEDQGKRFLAQAYKNSFDAGRRIASISPVFAWFRSDFGGSTEELLKFISRYAPEEAADALRDPGPPWRVRYTKYDWTLNE
jgi:nucleotide-binding universal stress UspA family protein